MFLFKLLLGDLLDIVLVKKLKYGQFAWYGMPMAGDKGFLKILVETNCIEVVRLLEEDYPNENQFRELSAEIRDLKKTFQHFGNSYTEGS